MKKLGLNKILIATMAVITLFVALAMITACGTDKHSNCDCEERFAQMENEMSQANERISTLESQIADMTTTTAETTTTEATTTTQATTTTTKKPGNGNNGGNGNNKTQSNSTTTTTTTTAAETSPTNGDGFGTDVGM